MSYDLTPEEEEWCRRFYDGMDFGEDEPSAPDEVDEAQT